MSHKVQLFAEKVVNFSSQYGTAGTNSYTAENLSGGLRVYAKYGDFQEAFVLVGGLVCCGVRQAIEELRLFLLCVVSGTMIVLSDSQGVFKIGVSNTFAKRPNW